MSYIKIALDLRWPLTLMEEYVREKKLGRSSSNFTIHSALVWLPRSLKSGPLLSPTVNFIGKGSFCVEEALTLESNICYQTVSCALQKFHQLY